MGVGRYRVRWNTVYLTLVVGLLAFLLWGSLPENPAVRALAEPVVDGLLDDTYTFLRAYTDIPDDPEEEPAPGVLYGYEGAETCYWAFVVDRGFNDNVYAPKGMDDPYLIQDGWVVGRNRARKHDFKALYRSDRAQFTVTGPGGSYAFYLDLLHPLEEGSTDPADYISGLTGYEGSNRQDPYVSAAATSTHWNILHSGWPQWYLRSPDDFNYNLHSGNYWEWQIIYEFAIPKAALSQLGIGDGCGQLEMTDAHNSPSKFVEERATIGDYVWHDANGNALQDDGGPQAGLANVTLYLWQDGAVVRTTSTGPDGSYRFVNLREGTYTVDVDESTLPPGFTLTTGNEPLTVTVEEEEDYEDADFGYAAVPVNTPTHTPTPAPTDTPTATPTHTPTPVHPAIGVSKYVVVPADGVAEIGSTVVFAIRVENLGDTTLVQVPLYDRYEADVLAFLGADIEPTQRTVQGTQGVLFWADITEALGDLPPGAAVEFRLAFRLIRARSTTNVVASGEAIDEYGNRVPPVSGQSSIGVRFRTPPQIFLPFLRKSLPVVPTPTPSPTPAPPKGQGEPGCPPEGCAVPGLVHPKGIGVHPGLDRLYIASRDTDSLLVFDLRTHQVVQRVATGREPWDVVVDPERNEVWVSNYASAEVWVYDATTLARKHRIATAPNPGMMALFPDLNTVAVVVRGIHGIAIIRDHRVVQYLGAGGRGPFGIAADPVGRQLMVSNRDTGNLWIHVFDPGANTWRTSGTELKFGERGERTVPFQVAYNPANRKLYVLYTVPSGAWYVDIFRKESLGSVPRIARVQVGNSGPANSPDVGGVGLEVNPSTGNVFVANTFDGTVSVISGARDELVATVSVGPDPYDVAVHPVANRVYVTLRAVNRLAELVDTY